MEKLELKWAPDSLFIDINQDTPATNDDTLQLTNSENDKARGQNRSQSKENTSTEIPPITKEPEKTTEEVKDATTFGEPKAITLEQAYKLFNSNVKFVDARDEADYLVGHITNSINIPFDDFDNHKQKLEQLPKEKPLVIYCAGTDCDLSILLGNLLFGQGYKQVYVFFGGWNEWVTANYPVEKSSE